MPPRKPPSPLRTTGGGGGGFMSFGKGLFKLRRHGDGGNAWTSSAPNLGDGLFACLFLGLVCLPVIG